MDSACTQTRDDSDSTKLLEIETRELIGEIIHRQHGQDLKIDRIEAAVDLRMCSIALGLWKFGEAT